MSAGLSARAAPLPWLDRFGPAWMLVMAVTGLGVIPFGATYPAGDGAISLVVADVDGSALLPVVLACMSAIGFALMGWSVRGFEARRACLGAGAQTLSYGGALALSVLPLAMLHGSLDLVAIATRQDTTLPLGDLAAALGVSSGAWAEPVLSLPRWGLVVHPLAVALVAVCGLGAMRLPPFDGVSAEAEARVSLHAEGSSLRLGTAVITDAANTLMLAAFLVTLGLGGWAIPWLDDATLRGALVHGYGPAFGTLLRAFLQVGVFSLKLVVVVMLLRAIGRRFPPMPEARMIFLCFRLFVPLAVVNVFATAYWLVARPGLH